MTPHERSVFESELEAALHRADRQTRRTDLPDAALDALHDLLRLCETLEHDRRQWRRLLLAHVADPAADDLRGACGLLGRAAGEPEPRAGDLVVAAQLRDRLPPQDREAVAFLAEELGLPLPRYVG